MVDSFLTLEDVNGVLYNNQEVWWYVLDMTKIPTSEFTNIKADFCNISYSKNVTWTSTLYEHYYKVEVENSMWKHYRCYDENGEWNRTSGYVEDNTIHIYSNAKVLKIGFLISFFSIQSKKKYDYEVSPSYLKLNLKELNTPQRIKFINMYSNRYDYKNCNLDKGYNLVSASVYGITANGYVYVELLKSDFQFNCTQSLMVGKFNKVALGTLTDYKPNGDMIGANTPTIQVLYKDTYIDVEWDNTLNDYCFNLDLTDKQNESNVRFKVFVEANDVLNASETEVSLSASYETINNATKLQQLFSNGGIGRLGANITLNTDLTLSKDVLIIGNCKTLTMANHKIILPSERTFKANNLTFTGGANTIQQNTNSKVELNECTFTNCLGLGSVIDCQVDIGSLENATDFTTILNECTISNCDMAILHGGDLTITNCQITGKIGNKDYPYFLYQTDGEATITGTRFSLNSIVPIDQDMEFNSCIFIVGENAVINNGDHTEWQTNNITGFLTNSRNTSSIDVTYYYDAITDYITLNSDNGFCHSVSGADMIYKTNVTATRSE